MLGQNNLIGTIPSELGVMERAVFVYPSQFCDILDNSKTQTNKQTNKHVYIRLFGLDCTYLRSSLDDNFIEGSIPAALGNAKNLQHLYASFIPLGFGSWVDHFLFTGDLVVSLAHSYTVYFCLWNRFISNAILNGTIPTSIYQQAALKTLLVVCFKYF
jgi:hypothetical protein